jgi:hypothetical protein
MKSDGSLPVVPHCFTVVVARERADLDALAKGHVECSRMAQTHQAASGKRQHGSLYAIRRGLGYPNVKPAHPLSRGDEGMTRTLRPEGDPRRLGDLGEPSRHSLRQLSGAAPAPLSSRTQYTWLVTFGDGV